jgi:2-polyprenyl-3-methyl-5-hydroxy-6-metoxy-1,4-benzoquinol methylase
MKHPELYSNFYKKDKLGFDLTLVKKGFEKFKNHFNGFNCLELGPSYGYMTSELVKVFQNVVAVEGSETLFNAIPNFNNLEKHNSLFEDFSTDEKFDTIILNHVLEHIENPVSLLKKIKTWMSPGGVLIIGVPNAKSFHRLAAVKMGLLNSEYELNERDHQLGHYRVYDFDSLIKDSSEAGLIVNYRGGLFIKFLSNSQIQEFLSQEIIESYFDLGDQFIENCAEIYIVLKND